MCPLSLEELEVWSSTKIKPKNNFEDWIKMDPYSLRAKAIHSQITLFELGRIFFQVSTHRGPFL